MARESRFAEIYRQQLMKDKGIFGAFASTASERAKERADLRRLLPKSGITGAISQRIFGKPYRSGTSSGVTEKADSARISRVDMNSQLTARNTSVLPAMAKEMNLTRLNIQKLVRLAGGTPSKTSTSAVKFKDRFSNESSTPTVGKPSSNLFGGLGNVASGIFNLGGGLLGGAASLTGSLIGGLGSMVGGMFGGIFRVIGGILSVGGPFGILLMIGAASLMKAIYDNFDFKSLGNLFGNTFDAISKSLKSFFGIDGEDSDKSFLQMIAEKLDSFFGTTKFTESLNYISQKLKEVADELEFQIKSVYVTITNHAIAAFKSFSDIMIAVGQDIKGIVLSWFDSNKVSIYSALGAGAGALGGPKGIAAGAAAGAAIAMVEQREESGGEIDKIALANLEKAVKEGTRPGTLESDKKRIEELKKRISERESKFYSGNVKDLVGGQQNILNMYQKNLAEAQQQNPQPTRPTKTTEMAAEDTSKLTRIRRTTEEYRKLSERISKTESGGNYEAMYPNTTLPGATQMTIAEVAAKAKGAVGKYQNMPQFLVERARDSGLDPNKDLYSPQNQEIIQENLLRENLKILEKAGVEATDENLYWAHRIGAGGVIKAMREWEKDSSKTLAEIFPKYASQNPDLRNVTSSNFASSGTGMLDNRRIASSPKAPSQPERKEPSYIESLLAAIPELFEIIARSAEQTNAQISGLSNVTKTIAEQNKNQVSSVNPNYPDVSLEHMALIATKST